MKKLIFILIPILLLGGGGAFVTARMGIIKIPGITPPVKKVAKAAPKKPDEAPKPTPPKVQEEAKVDPAGGNAALAKVWQEIDSKKLVKLMDSWRIAELAPVLLKMDPSKVSEILSEMEPKRSSEVSREIQRLASLSG